MPRHLPLQSSIVRACRLPHRPACDRKGAVQVVAAANSAAAASYITLLKPVTSCLALRGSLDPSKLSLRACSILATIVAHIHTAVSYWSRLKTAASGPYNTNQARTTTGMPAVSITICAAFHSCSHLGQFAKCVAVSMQNIPFDLQ